MQFVPFVYSGWSGIAAIRSLHRWLWAHVQEENTQNWSGRLILMMHLDLILNSVKKRKCFTGLECSSWQRMRVQKQLPCSEDAEPLISFSQCQLDNWERIQWRSTATSTRKSGINGRAQKYPWRIRNQSSSSPLQECFNVFPVRPKKVKEGASKADEDNQIRRQNHVTGNVLCAFWRGNEAVGVLLSENPAHSSTRLRFAAL